MAMATVVFAFLMFQVLSDQGPQSKPNVTIVGSIEDNSIILEHLRGESLDLNSELLVQIGGVDKSYPISNFLIDKYKKNGKWDIGEILKFDDSLIGLQVGAAIRDIYSNSLVFHGDLQQGYIYDKPKGGIWHFDNGDGDIAYDTSGNYQHGSIFNPIWTDGKNNDALEFKRTNYVRVYDSPALDITDEITLEAWIKPSKASEVINSTLFDPNVGYFPNITRVNNDIYAIVYRAGSNPNQDGVIKTMEILYDGEIINPEINAVIFDNSCNEPRIVRVDSDTVAIAYGDSGQNGYIKTYDISEGGLISYTGNSYKFDNKCVELSFVHVVDDIYAIAYGSNNNGVIKTFDISSEGVIQYTNYMMDFSSRCEDPEMINIDDDLFAVAYGDNNDWYLKTFNIGSDGQITYTTYSILIDINCDDPSMVTVSDTIIAVSYSYNGAKVGRLKTYSISAAGEITYTNNILDFENERCYDPDIAFINGQVFVIAYEGKLSHVGRLAKFNITDTGTIDLINNSVYESEHGYEPDIVKVSQHYFTIIYRYKSPHPGGISTFVSIEYTVPKSERGIFKPGEYGIYSNTTHIFAYLNDVSLVAAIEFSDNWNHIVLVYDGSNIRLFCNNNKVAEQAYSSSIVNSDNNLFFGQYFSGYIDEIAIYDRDLSDTEIQNHYLDPGSLAFE